MCDFLGSPENAVHLLKPLEQILTCDDSVVREKALGSSYIIVNRISKKDLIDEFLPLAKRMRKGDLFSMRICACFLYA